MSDQRQEARSAAFAHATTCAIGATGFCTCGSEPWKAESAASPRSFEPAPPPPPGGKQPKPPRSSAAKSPVAGEPGEAATSPGSTTAASGLRVKLTTHKVVIDANDEAHAADLYERLHNDGFRVHRETHKLVQDDLGYMSTEVERVG